MTTDFNLDDWLNDYQPHVVEASIVQKAGLITEHTRREMAWIQARATAGDVMHDPAVADAERALRECEAEIKASETTFSFTGIGHEEWQNLKRKYPPTRPQREAGDDVNLDAWAPEVIAACSHEPKVTLAQAQTMMRKLPPGEFEKLFRACSQANSEVAGAPKSVLAALTDRSRQRDGYSITGLHEASLDDVYSDTLADPLPE